MDDVDDGEGETRRSREAKKNFCDMFHRKLKVDNSSPQRRGGLDARKNTG
jgi:hypothetical protein